jgi:uncharacterized protein
VTRPNNPRRVGFLPEVVYFKPAGVPIVDLQEVLLGQDEFEAIRLKDLLGMSQEEAAKEMHISQPTFHRLVLTARQKIADAFVNGKAVRIEGGNVCVGENYSQACRWRKRWGCKAKALCEDEMGEIKVRAEGGMIMNIAITSIDGTMDGMVDERFGRSRKIIVYNKEKKSVEVVDNTVNMNSPQGAGIQTAQNVAKTSAQVVISGHLGPNAFRVLQAAGIEAYSASNMTAKEALKKLDEGVLTKLAGADVEGHW